jgi:methylmalonyl-CoA mutase N-terminal domain/subunit
VRTAVEALAAVLGGTNSLHTNALDEVLALPSAKAAQIALRTQQVIAEETGVADVADPLGGSWYVEALTDELERQAESIFTRIREMGPDGTMTAGILRGIEDGWFTGQIAEAASTYQRALEKGEKKVVGVNTLTDAGDAADPLEILRVSHQVETDQRAELAARRRDRDDDAARAAVARMVEVARTDRNMVPAMLEAARAEATLGEVCDALRDEWGTYTEPARFCAPPPVLRPGSAVSPASMRSARCAAGAPARTAPAGVELPPERCCGGRRRCHGRRLTAERRRADRFPGRGGSPGGRRCAQWDDRGHAAEPSWTS